MSDIEGFILLGGRSSRMGCDKAQLQLGGEQFVERIAKALSNVAELVSIVGAKEPIRDWRLPNVADVYPEWGALGGVHAALAACRLDWAAIVACDLPFASGELIVRLASLREGFDSVIPVQDEGWLQPLCGLYRRAPCLPVVKELIESGERRPRALVERVKARLVAASELSDLNHSNLFFMNINTPEDYARAKKNVIGDNELND